MLRIFHATFLVLLVGCSATTITRVAENNRSLYPHGRVHVGWSEFGLFFPLMIHADAALPPVGESVPAQKAFKDISILNCRSDDTEYPKGSSDAWLRDMKGTLRLISEEQIMIDAYFLDGKGERRSYPFTGKHKIVQSEWRGVNVATVEGHEIVGNFLQIDWVNNLLRAEQGGAEQAATALQSMPEGDKKSQQGSEGRSR